MEKLARLQYLKNKDPKDCALLYIALNRLQVLAGLFKISKDEKDKPLVAFLARNFQVFFEQYQVNLLIYFCWKLIQNKYRGSFSNMLFRRSQIT